MGSDENRPLAQSRWKWVWKAAGSTIEILLDAFSDPGLSSYPLPVEYLSWALSLKASYRHRLGLETE